jgi:hypothetical protein
LRCGRVLRDESDALKRQRPVDSGKRRQKVAQHVELAPVRHDKSNVSRLSALGEARGPIVDRAGAVHKHRGRRHPVRQDERRSKIGDDGRLLVPKVLECGFGVAELLHGNLAEANVKGRLWYVLKNGCRLGNHDVSDMRVRRVVHRVAVQVIQQRVGQDRWLHVLVAVPVVATVTRSEYRKRHLV